MSSREGKRLDVWIPTNEDKKLEKISMELLGKKNKTQALIILIKQYRLENETNN